MSAIISFFSYILALLIALPGIISSGGESINDYSFSVDASAIGTELPNVVSNVNIWDMNGSDQFTNLKINDEYNIGEFVEYVQFMQCTGGNETRDLFKNPLDATVLDDYDFTRLIDNCKGVLELGAKPHLKLGSVPIKYSANALAGEDFGTNIYPPDDYDVYYNYMAAMAQALVDEFGKEELLKWRFGVMTEYENSQWFMAVSGDPQESAVEYCKLYDYTVAALQEKIGENVVVGAHSMTVTEGLWDENIFIDHCANGINYKTGKKGTRICFLTGSFYDYCPGEPTSGYTLPKTIAFLQNCAKKAGLKDIIFGIDEGRLLCGINSGADDNQLFNRTVGYTYQAAYDARVYKQLFDSDADYFSAWGYLSNGLFDGNPTVSYHVARNIAKFANSNRTSVEKAKSGVIYKAEVDAVSAYDADTKTLRVMAYNFKDDIEYSKSADLNFEVKLSQLEGETVQITKYVIDDNCNYFDEWVKDRVTYGIGDECFAWSPDDPCIDTSTTLRDSAAREIYFTQLRDKYYECSKLVPVTQTTTVENGKLLLEDTLAPNGVIFYEIAPVK
ncbi:MAG: hypothetical protein IJA02_05520 [Clostridia bacterium]|nr:hypothetical protein [Clostridia bacterium]